MGLFGDFAYPNASYFNDDLRELIRLYNELKATYDGLQEEIQSVKDLIDTLPEYVDTTVKQQIEITMSLYTQRLKKVEEQVKELESIVVNFRGDIANINDKITALQKELRDAIYMFNQMHQALLQEFHEYKYNIGKYVDGKVELLEKYIYDTVTTLERLDVINPITHKFEDINVVLADLWKNIQLSFGITAEEYDNLKLTAWEYDYQRIKAIDNDTKAYFIFWELRQGLMTSPFNGTQTHYSNVIQMLANLHKCTFTAKQFDELECTAIDYDAWMINAFNYDWYGRQMILKKEGITAQDYDTANITAEFFDNEKFTAYRYDMYGKVLIERPDIFTKKCMSCNEDVLKPIPNA